MNWKRLFSFARQDKTPSEDSRPVQEAVEDRWLIPSGYAYKPEDIQQWIIAAQGGDPTSLYAFCDEMRARDTHLQSELGKAERKALGSRIDILPYPAKHRSRVRGKTLTGDAALAAQVAEYCEDTLLAPDVRLEHAARALMNGFWKGLGAFQVIAEPRARDEKITLLPVPSQRFFCEPNSTTLMVMTTGQRSSAVPVESLGTSLVVFQPDADIPDPARRGLYRSIFPFYAIRTFGPSWWSRFVELFGLPLRKGTFPRDNPSVKSDLITALDRAGNKPWVVVPEGAAVEFVNGVNASNGDIHPAILDWTAREISKAVLGATQGTDVQKGAGSKASAEVHERVSAELAISRGREVAIVLRQQLLLPLVSRKFGPEVAQRFTPEVAFRTDDRSNLLELSQAVKNFADAGFGEAIPLSLPNELAGIPVPEEGEPTVSKKPEPLQQQMPQLSRVSFTAKPSAAAELAGLEEWAVRRAAGSGEEILAPYEHILSQAEADGATLEQVYARIVQQSGIPPESPHLIDLLAAVQMEALMRGLSRERRR